MMKPRSEMIIRGTVFILRSPRNTLGLVCQFLQLNKVWENGYDSEKYDLMEMAYIKDTNKKSTYRVYRQVLEFTW